MEKKTIEVSDLLVDLNDIRFQDVDTKMHDLLENQQVELVMEKIGNFATSIQTLITLTKERHEAAASLMPTDELVKQAELFEDTARLPTVSRPEEWFTFNRPSKERDHQGMIVVNFIIPLVKPEKFNEFVAINITLEGQPEIIFDNGELAERVCLSDDNKTMFYPEKTRKIYKNMYDNIQCF